MSHEGLELVARWKLGSWNSAGAVRSPRVLLALGNLMIHSRTKPRWGRQGPGALWVVVQLGLLLNPTF